MNFSIIATILIAILIPSLCASSPLPTFSPSPNWGEQVLEERLDCGVRVLFNAPADFDPKRPTTLIFYATPNGNTIEQTLGCKMVPDLDWHYDIQHIAAQTRVLREINKRENVVLACTQTDIRSWPTWRSKHSDNPSIIKKLVEEARNKIPGDTSVVLTGHSGGGSMISGFIDAYDKIPDWVNRIAYLDANYSYSDELKHGNKLLDWFRESKEHHLVVIAYDDRSITLNGKPVVTTGGTFRASHRMLNRFEKEGSFIRSSSGDIDRYDGLNGQINIFLHRNPKNKILHTVLVGEMNGYLAAMTLGKPEETKWGSFGQPRAYTKWIQPSPLSIDKIPVCPRGASGGKTVMQRVAGLALKERETVLLDELKSGNIPGFLRSFITVKVTGKDAKGKDHTICLYVMPDYLSVGANKDFVRVPLTPMTAQAVADAFDCTLPTRKMVDDIYKQAQFKLDPKPLTEARESVETFILHNDIIEKQRSGQKPGALVSGIKKDVVLTSRLLEKPDHVAIYGWHKLDGTPIQPLTTVHINTYVDYSHGIRLIKRTVLVDGNPRDIGDVLADPDLCVLLSDEGSIASQYRPSSPDPFPR